MKVILDESVFAIWMKVYLTVRTTFSADTEPLVTFLPFEKACHTHRENIGRMCREAGAIVTRKGKLRDSRSWPPPWSTVGRGRHTQERSQFSRNTLGNRSHNQRSCIVTSSPGQRGNVELVASERCRLVVVALETGGRWSMEVLEFVAHMTFSRARDAPPALRRAAFLAWRKRWTRNAVSLV